MTEAFHVILVVDDEAPVRDFVAVTLTLAGYVVLTAENGKQALAKAQEKHIDLLLTDVLIPGIDGLALASACLRLRPDTRIMLMSGYSSELGRIKASRWTFLEKPFQMGELLDSVAVALSATSGDRWKRRTKSRIVAR